MNEPTSELNYLHGFGNHFASEAVPGALPLGRNSPQKAAHGLYAELLSGTAFTAPRREQPAHLDVSAPAQRDAGRLRAAGARRGQDRRRATASPRRPTRCAGIRWPFPNEPLDFVDGLHTMVVNGDADAQTGMAAHLYLANRSMQRAFVNADGEMLVVPQQGVLHIDHRTGPAATWHPARWRCCRAAWRSGCAIDGPSRGYVCENYGAHVSPARTGADRLQRAGQCARLPGAGGGLRSDTPLNARW